MARPKRTVAERLAAKNLADTRAKAAAYREAAIDPQATYRRAEVPALIKVGTSTLADEIKRGAIRFRRVGRCYLFRGQWLIDWLEGKKPETTDTTTTTNEGNV